MGVGGGDTIWGGCGDVYLYIYVYGPGLYLHNAMYVLIHIRKDISVFSTYLGSWSGDHNFLELISEAPDS